MALLITEYGTYRNVKPQNGRVFFMSEIEALIGGPVVVRPNDQVKPYRVYAHACALEEQRPRNAVASLMLAYEVLGPVLICNGGEAGLLTKVG